MTKPGCLLPLFLVLTLLLWPVKSFAPPPDEEQALFSENLDITTELFLRKPGAIYVPLGRSPTPIQVLLSLLAPDSSVGLPLSLRDKKSEAIPYPLDAVTKGRLHAHLDRFFPEKLLKSGRELVLIDYFDTGETLILAHKVISDYLAERGYKNPVSVFAMGVTTEYFEADLAKAKVPALHYALDGPLLDAYDDNHWKDKSAFPSFKPRELDSVTPKRRRKQYDALVKEYREKVGTVRVQQVTTIRQALAKNPSLFREIAFPVRASCLDAFTRVLSM